MLRIFHLIVHFIIIVSQFIISLNNSPERVHSVSSHTYSRLCITACVVLQALYSNRYTSSYSFDNKWPFLVGLIHIPVYCYEHEPHINIYLLAKYEKIALTLI